MLKNQIESQDLRLLCQKYLFFYKTEGLSLSLSEVSELVKKAVKDAEKAYKKLIKPKTCSLATYTRYWLREVILKDFTKRTIKEVRIPINNSDITNDDFAKALATYLSVLPLRKLPKLYRKLLRTFPYKEREALWKEKKLLFRQLEKNFVPLAIARNKLARNKGYAQYMDMILANRQIPRSAYRKFNKNIDAVITRCYQQLPKLSNLPIWFYSRFNLPCFVCQIPFPNLAIPEDVINLVEKNYPILGRFRHRLYIRSGDNAWIRYRKEKDNFEIMLRKTSNNRHKALELIHELSHMAGMLEDFKKGREPFADGRYALEKKASIIELAVLRTLSRIVFRTRLADILLIFHRILFELALYDNPKQNLPKLYAKIFNRCFPDANQKTNFLYLLDQYIVLKPLSSLPHAVAYLNVL